MQMNKRARQTFYRKMETKYGMGEELYNPRSIAGVVLNRVGIVRCNKLLESADSFDEWLTLCKVHLDKTGRNSADIKNAMSRIKRLRSFYASLRSKYHIKENHRELRSDVDKMIRRYGVSQCEKQLHANETFAEWINSCRASRKSNRIRKRRRKNKSSRKLTRLMGDDGRAKYLEAIKEGNWKEAADIRKRFEDAAERKSTEAARKKQRSEEQQIKRWTDAEKLKKRKDVAKKRKQDEALQTTLNRARKAILDDFSWQD